MLFENKKERKKKTKLWCFLLICKGDVGRFLRTAIKAACPSCHHAMYSLKFLFLSLIERQTLRSYRGLNQHPMLCQPEVLILWQHGAKREIDLGNYAYVLFVIFLSDVELTCRGYWELSVSSLAHCRIQSVEEKSMLLLFRQGNM